MKLSLPPKLVEKLQVVSFCTIFIPIYAFDALLCQNWSFSPPDRLTLMITLLLSTSWFVHKGKSLNYGHWQLDGFTRSVAKRGSPWIRWPSTMECLTTG